tara:strand:+ start:35 stop:556 length:522 start_codon:yes stop_codon:yes gene_type:complete
MNKRKIPFILMGLCIFSSIMILVLYILGFRIFTSPELTPKELLEQELAEDNSSSDKNEDLGLVAALLPPKLTYFQFVLSFTSNFKNDKNIMNMELALATFEGEGYHARLKHHEPALRRVVLDTMAEIEEESVKTKKGKDDLASILLSQINLKLEQLEEDSAIESVHFSSFAIR